MKFVCLQKEVRKIQDRMILINSDHLKNILRPLNKIIHFLCRVITDIN